MAYSEGLQFDQIFWQDKNERRQLSAFGKIPEIEVIKAGSDGEEGMV